MANATHSPTPAPETLPDSYDRLISIDRLIHGEHNPRQVAPTTALRRSIEREGIDRPLIVRPDPTRDLYHVTDGWQRYQAATACGWELLPVRVYDSPLEALRATETASIVREWSTYEWARYCQSLATELDDGTTSQHQLAQQVASQTTKSPQTVRRYLETLSLPTEVHPLLCDGPAGTEREWQALKHYNDSVRRYTGLPWHVAARLGKRAADADLSEDRIVAIAANAVAYEADVALEFVDVASEQPAVPLRTVRALLEQTGAHEDFLHVPSVAVSMDHTEKEAIMSYCAAQRTPLSQLIETLLSAFVADLADGEGCEDNPDTRVSTPNSGGSRRHLECFDESDGPTQQCRGSR